MPTQNIAFSVDPTSILVEPGGIPEQDGDMMGAVVPNGLVQLETLRQGSNFTFYRILDGQTGNDVIYQVVRLKRNVVNVLGDVNEFFANALHEFSGDGNGNGIGEHGFRILGVAQYMGMPCLVLPYYQRSILQALTDVAMLYLWLADAGEDLARLHARGRVHGAITPGKILICDNNRAFVSGVVSHELQDILNPDTIPLRSDFTLEAPEVVSAANPQKTLASDVFQFGMVIHRILGGTPPKKLRFRALRDHALGRFGLKMPPLANAEIFTLIQLATALDPADRPSMDNMALTLRAIAGG